jgi:hypothetical protein
MAIEGWMPGTLVYVVGCFSAMLRILRQEKSVTVAGDCGKVTAQRLRRE